MRNADKNIVRAASAAISGSSGNLANQSACKWFMRFTESGTDFTDAVSGSVLSCTSGIVDVARTIPNAVDLSYVAPNDPTLGFPTGTIGCSKGGFPTIDPSLPLIAAAGIRVIDSNNVRIPMGAETGIGGQPAGFTASFGTSLHGFMSDGTDAIHINSSGQPALTVGSEYIVFLTWDGSTTLRVGAINSDGALNQAITNTGTPAAGPFTPYNSTRPGGGSWYFWGVWQPPVLPSDAQLYAGAAWMLACAKTGRKAPYFGPGWV